MDAATKIGIDAAKTDSKQVFQKTAEAVRVDLIGKKIADKLLHQVKQKINKKKTKDKKSTYHQNKQIQMKQANKIQNINAMIRSVFLVMHILFVKGTATNPDNNAYNNQLLKIMDHLFLAFQKLIKHSLTTQKIQIL